MGTRLRSVVSDRPKVLALVRGRPFLAYILDQLADAGISHVVLCTGYRGDLVEAAFGKQFHGMSLEYSRERAPLGTAGALRLAGARCRSDEVLVLNGDSFCRVDLEGFGAFHQAKRGRGSLVAMHVADAGRFGGLVLDENDRVVSFREKKETAAEWSNAGIYLLRRADLAAIESDRIVSLEREVLPAWNDLFAFRCRGEFLDIGTPESYAQADRFFGAGSS